MKKILLIFIVIFSVSVTLMANLPSGISKGFKSADAQELSKYFEPTLELSVNGKQSMYSKAQATQVLRDFFNANNPTGLVEKHSGGRGNSQFSVFAFSTGTDKYRATVFFKGSGEDAKISQITIEKDNGF
ncbi:MAG: DUF4783 domain-containing protein [Flavobacteriaceae bacterium]|nr:DUF4783 domain-containing protein [Flavobacteriaceae bacterium]